MRFYYTTYDGGPTKEIHADSIDIAYMLIKQKEGAPPHDLWN